MSTETLDVTFTNLSQLSRAYGTPAVEMAERVLQQSAHGQLIQGVVAAGVAIVFAGLCFWCGHSAKDDDMNIGAVFGAILFGLIACGATILSCICLSDVWMWTALTNPALALSHKIFGSMGGS